MNYQSKHNFSMNKVGITLRKDINKNEDLTVNKDELVIEDTPAKKIEAGEVNLADDKDDVIV